MKDFVLCTLFGIVSLLLASQVYAEIPFKLSLGTQYSKISLYQNNDPHTYKAGLLLFDGQQLPYIYYTQTNFIELLAGSTFDFTTPDHLFQHAIFPNCIGVKSTLFDSHLQGLLAKNEGYASITFSKLFGLSYLTEQANPSTSSEPLNRQTGSAYFELPGDAFSLLGGISYSQLNDTQKTTGTGLLLGASVPYYLIGKSKISISKISWAWNGTPQSFEGSDLYLDPFWKDLSQIRNTQIDAYLFGNQTVIDSKPSTIHFDAFSLASAYFLNLSIDYEIDKHLGLQFGVQKTNQDFKITGHLNVVGIVQ